jgi:hypothetical protein
MVGRLFFMSIFEKKTCLLSKRGDKQTAVELLGETDAYSLSALSICAKIRAGQIEELSSSTKKLAYGSL